MPSKFKTFLKFAQALSPSTKKINTEKWSAIMTMDFRNLDEMKELLFPTLDIDMSSWINKINEEVDSAQLYPETTEVLEKLKNKGYEMGVISNLATPYKKPYYTLGLDKYCSFRVFSCEVGYKKPEIGIYRIVEDNFLAREKKIIMIGDNYVCDYAAPIFFGWEALLLNRSEKKSGGRIIKNLTEIFGYL